uniref:TF_AP-2 domain-containing protein n=1 Tax=Rhabditophanes sp. KR3021 TaxID=114890 RepID=A0AC35UBL7_9BILA
MPIGDLSNTRPSDNGIVIKAEPEGNDLLMNLLFQYLSSQQNNISGLDQGLFSRSIEAQSANTTVNNTPADNPLGHALTQLLTPSRQGNANFLATGNTAGGSLPREPEKASHKRPAAIQDMLSPKRAKKCKKNNENVNVALAVVKTEASDTETNSSGDANEINWLNPAGSPPFNFSAIFNGSQLLNTENSSAASPSVVTNGVIERNVDVPIGQLFGLVPGRLSLLSNVSKHRVCVAEIKRRIIGPESFNFSLLGALLRRAKMPEKSLELVRELAEVGITISRGRRRISNVTLMSALTETESVGLAGDFRTVTRREFPINAIAEDAARNSMQGSKSSAELAAKAAAKCIKLRNALEIIQEYNEYLLADRSPILDQAPPAVLASHLQEPLSHFSCLTHGFGVSALMVGAETATSFINAQLDHLSKTE